jgi:glycosyltransferase involved in cell wall biosynthesis
VSAYYAPAFVYGGPPRSIHGLCVALRRHGVDIEVLTTDANGVAALPPAVTAAGDYEVVPVPYCPRGWPEEPIASSTLVSALRAAFARADLVHIHGLWNRVVWGAASACRRAGVPYVLSPRGMLEPGAIAHHAWRKRAAYALFERRTLTHASLVHATSEQEARTVARWQPGVRTVTIPNGIALDAPSPSNAIESREPPDVRVLILFVGRIHAIKRLDLLLDAFARLRSGRRDVHLVIAGPDEQGLRAVLERRHAGLERAVSWVGAVDAGQRQALLARARALVLCSDSESFGMVVLEALAASRPVVVAETCGWSVLRDRQAGFVVPQSAEAIAHALDRLVANAELAESMGRRGRQLVESSFTWDAVARTFIPEYEAVLTACRSGVAC